MDAPANRDTNIRGAQTSSKLAMSPSETLQERDDPNVPIDGQCFLLELPRELRDMIYVYALSYEAGLSTYYAPPFDSYPPPPPPVGMRGHLYVGDGFTRSNQLKLVCKQLRTETTGLELPLNTLTFRGNNRRSGNAVFSWFMHCDCSPAHKSRIREVVISDEKDRNALDVLSELMGMISDEEFQQGICGPKATTFKIYLKLFNVSSPYNMWTSVGSELQQSLHEIVPDIPKNPSLQEYEFARWIGILSRQEEDKVPANVRLLPFAFNELKFRSDVAELMDSDEIEEWVQQCHSWVANGF